jgi:hypothetical protein
MESDVGRIGRSTFSRQAETGIKKDRLFETVFVRFLQ